MELSSYEVLYIIGNTLGTYTIYSFMRIFFNTLKVEKNFELISYIIYFILSTSIYLIVDIPIVMLIFNIIAFFILTFNYDTNIKERIITVICVYFILMCIEVLVAVFTGYSQIFMSQKADYTSVGGIFTIKLISYITVVIIGGLKRIKKKVVLPIMYWVSIIMIPCSSIYIVVLMLRVEDMNEIQRITIMIFLLIINFSVFYLYDAILDAISDKTEKLILTAKQILSV